MLWKAAEVAEVLYALYRCEGLSSSQVAHLLIEEAVLPGRSHPAIVRKIEALKRDGITLDSPVREKE